jgi:hypothetical protein
MAASGKHPTVAKATDFLKLVHQSGVVDEARLTEYLAQWPPGQMPAEAKQLAVRMVQDRILTSFQASALLQGKWRGFIISGKYRVLKLIGAGGAG